MMRSHRVSKRSERRCGSAISGPTLLGALILAIALVSAGESVVLGSLTQLAGTAACVSDDGTGGACADGVALAFPRSVVVSPEGTHVYVASAVSDAVAVFARNKTTGALTQVAGIAGCVSETGTGGLCADGVGLSEAYSVDISPDGKHVYVASGAGDAVAIFARTRTTGALTQLAGTASCVSATGTGGLCATGVGLDAPRAVVVSPDSKHVYVVSDGSSAVAIFTRNRTTGALTQLAGTAGCVSETGTGGLCTDGEALAAPNGVAVSPDGHHVYVASLGSDAVAVFRRHKYAGALTQLAGTAGCVSETGTGGLCTEGVALVRPISVALSPDGKHVYVASEGSDAVAVFARNTTTGALTQLAGTAGCVSETGTGGLCAAGVALDAPFSVAVSRDGRNVYVASFNSNAVATFARNKVTGALTQLAGTAGCVSETGTGGLCSEGVALDGAHSVAVSADGKHLYLAAQDGSAVAVFVRH